MVQDIIPALSNYSISDSDSLVIFNFPITL